MGAPHMGGMGGGGHADLLVEKEATIQELRETVEILELKIKKLEQLVRLKESKITTLNSKLHQHGVQ